MAVNYDKQANWWKRDKPKHNSDFFGRPEVLEWVKKNGQNKIILDLGCGEGYFSRQLANFSKKVIGVDLSTEMIKLAKKQNQKDKLKIEYHTSDVKKMDIISNNSIDICVGNYVTNYLTDKKLVAFYKEINRVLKPKGHFILLSPHPWFELTADYGRAMHYKPKDVKNFHYLKSRNKIYYATLDTAQGNKLEVLNTHTTLGDHFNGINSANLTVSNIIELVFPKKIAEKYPVFKKLINKITAIIIIGQK